MASRMDDAYYAARLGEDPVVEVRVTAAKGKGMFMRRAVPKGEIIFRDTPLVSLQHIPNQATSPACHRCHTAVGSLESQLEAASGRSVSEPLLAGAQSPLKPVVQCASRCGVVYCSEECRDVASEQHHLLLCTGSLDDDAHALVAFKLFSLAHNEIYLLAARLFCRVIRNSHLAGHYTFHPFSLLRALPWSQAVVYKEPSPEGEHSHTEEEDEDSDMFRSPLSAQELEEQAAEAFGLLKDALLSEEIAMRDPALAPTIVDCLQEGRLDEACFSRCIGMFETNCTSIEHTHPLGRILRQEAEAHPGANQKQLVNRLWQLTVEYGEDDEEDDEDTVPDALTEDTICALEDRVCHADFEGIGVFDVVAVMNHSCMPNCEVTFTNDFRAYVEATRDIAVGEELTHSYIEEYDEMDTEERAEILKCWGFECDCAACRH